MVVRFRFYGELNDFLLPAQMNAEFEQQVGATDTLKHVIESIGVPHTEIGQVYVNGEMRNISQPLSKGDRVRVFAQVTPIHLTDPRFVLDGHLGRLAAYLRMLGFDTWYERSADDPLLALTSNREDRLLLTRDVGLLKRSEVRQGYCVRSDRPRDQLREVSRRFALDAQFTPFTRCMECNGLLASVEKSEIASLLPPHTRETKNEFSRCTECGRIFWRGSHHARMLGWIRDLRAERIEAPCTRPV